MNIVVLVCNFIYILPTYPKKDGTGSTQQNSTDFSDSEENRIMQLKKRLEGKQI